MSEIQFFWTVAGVLACPPVIAWAGMTKRWYLVTIAGLAWSGLMVFTLLTPVDLPGGATATERCVSDRTFMALMLWILISLPLLTYPITERCTKHP